MNQPLEVKEFIIEQFSNNDCTNLLYHSLGHSLEVTETVVQLCATENLPQETSDLMQISALLHDVGYLYTYHGHEDKGKELAQIWMPGWGYNKDQISFICSMIEATKLSHTPQNLLESIISDADLAYGITDHFFVRGSLLRKEWELYLNKFYSEQDWEILQLNFLQTIKFHSDYAKIHFNRIVVSNLKKQQIRVNTLAKE